MRARRLEVCVDDARGLRAAIAGGADRIELCSALASGGLTPSPGLMELAAAAPVPVVVMIRPRAGAFDVSPEDLGQMCADIRAVRSFGLSGIVVGASRPDGRLDQEVLEHVLDAAKGLPAVLHRAFDLVPDRSEALETAIRLGFVRVLTSGGSKTAPEGLSEIVDLVRKAAGRIEILPGSGINLQTVGPILDALPEVDIHASCSGPDAEPLAGVRALGFLDGAARRTDEAIVRALKARISS
nr:copper homeostasis protein CutC [uncultured Gellertiella sp.]